MTDRTGLGPLEIAVLEAMDTLRAVPMRPYTKNARIVNEVARSHGFGQDYAYDVLCDLVRPWRCQVPLVDFHGNCGSQDLPAAPPSFTESRLSKVGALALEAERSATGAVPIALINGDTHQGGLHPPFAARGVLDAIGLLLDGGATDDEVLAALGPPVFPGGCEVSGDMQAVLRGEATDLALFPRAEVTAGSGAAVLDLTAFPPYSSPREITHRLQAHLPHMDRDDGSGDDFDRLPITEVQDLSSGLVSRVRVRLERGADPNVVVHLLRNGSDDSGPHREPPLRCKLIVEIGQPVALLLRNWVSDHSSGELAAWLGRLRECLSERSRRQGGASVVSYLVSAPWPGTEPPDRVERPVLEGELAHRPLPRALEAVAPVSLTLRNGTQLSGTSSGQRVAVALRGHTTGRARGAVDATAVSATWGPTGLVDGRLHMILEGWLGGAAVRLDADLDPPPGALFRRCRLSGAVSGEMLDATVAAADSRYGGSQTVAIDGALGSLRISLLIAIAGDHRAAVVRGSYDASTVHLDVRRERRSGHTYVAGSHPGPVELLLLSVGAIASFL